METQNVFPDEMGIDRPVFRKLRVTGFKADSTEIAGESIEPDIEYVRRIVRERNTPFQRFAADGQILQAAFNEGDDFITTAFRTDETRILLIQFQQPIPEFRQFEKIGFL